jgi:hypothetical protein
VEDWEEEVDLMFRPLRPEQEAMELLVSVLNMLMLQFRSLMSTKLMEVSREEAMRLIIMCLNTIAT